jgi:hypothetical protein
VEIWGISRPRCPRCQAQDEHRRRTGTPTPRCGVSSTPARGACGAGWTEATESKDHANSVVGRADDHHGAPCHGIWSAPCGRSTWLRRHAAGVMAHRFLAFAPGPPHASTVLSRASQDGHATAAVDGDDHRGIASGARARQGEGRWRGQASSQLRAQAAAACHRSVKIRPADRTRYVRHSDTFVAIVAVAARGGHGICIRLCQAAAPHRRSGVVGRLERR